MKIVINADFGGFSLSAMAADRLVALGVPRMSYWGDWTDKERANPLLIQVVEELGAAANGSVADLKVIEIPDGTEWVIEEYDGLEHVAEAHRIWV